MGRDIHGEKGPVVSVENGFSQMFARRADRKPAVIPIVCGNNIAENVESGIKKIRTILKPIIWTKKFNLPKKRSGKNMRHPLQTVGKPPFYPMKYSLMNTEQKI